MSIKNHQALSREAVFSILDELQANGIQATVALIREHFDSAPYSVISDYLTDWLNQHETSKQDKFPAGPENISQGLARLWAQARLLSDEETEKERLDLAGYRHTFVKEKQDMLFEIQRLEKEYQPQENLRDRFNAERCKLEEQIEILHNEIKEIRLKQVEEKIDKQRIERDGLSIELQKTQLHEELEEKSDFAQKLIVENKNNQEQLLIQNTELDNTNHDLSIAQTKIEELLVQNSELDKTNHDLTIAKAKIEELSIQNAELDKTNHDLSVAQTKIEELSIQNAELDKTNHDLSIAQTKIEELLIQNSELDKTSHDLLIAETNVEELLIQNAELDKTSHALSIAQTKIEELLKQIEEQQSSIDPDQITNLQSNIDSLQTALSQSESKLKEFDIYKSEQHSTQENLESNLELEKQKRMELEAKYSKSSHENEELKETLLKEKIAAEDSINLEKKVKELTKKTTQYKNVLKDKQTRYDKLEKDKQESYDVLKKENTELRSANELKAKSHTQEKESTEESLESTNASLIKNIENEVASLGRMVPELELDEDLEDDANASKLKDGEKILELVKKFAIDGE